MGYYADLPADSSASALLFGGPGQAQESQEVQQNSDVIEGAAEAELQQVDESYDPTDFFSSIGKGGVEEQQHVEVVSY